MNGPYEIRKGVITTFCSVAPKVDTGFLLEPMGRCQNYTKDSVLSTIQPTSWSFPMPIKRAITGSTIRFSSL